MLKWLLLLFIVVPLVELYLLLTLASAIGFWPTIAITVLTAFVGSALAKREGLRVWRAWRRALDELRPPEEGVIDGVLVLVGGVLLITPGVLTDLTGVLLMLPFTRRRIAALIRKNIDRRIADGRLRVADASFIDVQNIWQSAPSGDVVDTTGETIGAQPELPRERDREP